MNNLNILNMTSRMTAPAIAVAGSLLLSFSAPSLANVHNGQSNHTGSLHQMRALHQDLSGRELRQMIRSQRGLPVDTVQQNVSTVSTTQSSIQQDVQTSNRSQFVNDNGRLHSVVQGLDLDLSSDAKVIVLGNKLFAESPSYTINIGGETKVLSAGDKVSAAEYVALQQVVASGAQSLVVDHSGKGVAGRFDLNSISDGGTNLRAASLVIPESVIAVGDFSRKADGLRVTNDLVNYGSVYATSTNPEANTVRISARDINNEHGALITTEIPASITTGVGHSEKTNLSLRADRNIHNAGAIISSGDLELSAAGSINNAGSARAEGTVLISSANVTNSGTITSNNGNVNLAGLGDVDLLVNNAGGTINALNGAINVRSDLYNGLGNSTVTGGDLISQQLNLFTGLGTTDVFVNKLTGVLSSTGTAVHVGSNTENLTIGSQCLAGDPTYYNNGQITINGNIIVGENLAIISSNVINSVTPGLTIRARDVSGVGRNIYIIAGAEILSGGATTGAGLNAQPPITQNSLSDVTISGNVSSTGGFIDFSFGGVLIDATGNGTNTSGGNVVLAAFDGATKAGFINLGTATIQTFGTGTANNGNVDIIYGYQNTSVGTVVGSINTRNGTGNAGTVNIINSQPKSSDSSSIVFSNAGTVTSGNTITFSSLSATGNNLLQATDIASSGDVTISSGGPVTINSIVASGNIPGDNGKIVSISSTNSSVTTTGLLDVSGVTSGSGGAVFINSNDNNNFTTVNQINADAGPTGNQGGTVDIRNNGSGGVTLSGNISARGFGNGTVNVDATLGQLLVNSANIQVGSNNLAGTDGTITLSADNILINSNLTLLGLSAGRAGAINVTTNTGGIVAPGADFIAQSSNQLNLNLFNNLIDARGVTTAGGSIDLRAPAINFASSKVNPLTLLTDGDANNSGGSVFFDSSKAVATVIGQPAVKKLPKGPTDFLVVSANAGNSSAANGGDISINVGGSITADPAGIQNSASSLGGDGGTIALASGKIFNKKGSPIVITGSLNVSGINGGAGGNIVLTFPFKKDFVLGATKAPKNGVFGNLTANGTGGSVLVSSSIGGVKVLSSNAVSGDTITLQASGKGRLRESKGAVVTAGDTLILSAGVSDITFTFSAPKFSIGSSTGDFHLTNTIAGSSTLLTGSVGGNFSLTAQGLSIAGDLSTTSGDIAVNVTSPFETLSVEAGVTVTANNGSLLLQHNDSTGIIHLDDNSVVETAGAGGAVSIIVGPAPSKPSNSSPPFVPPPTLVVTPTGAGQVFFGASPSQIFALGTVASHLNATNKNVILNVPVGAIGAIQIEDNVRIEADPPAPAAGGRVR